MKIRIMLLSLLVALISSQAFSLVATVGLCAGGGNHFNTIQAAVNAVSSSPNSTVKVCPGTYPEQITITTNLTLLGVVGGTADAAVVTVPADGLAANNVTDIFGFPTAAQIFVQNATVTISHITVDGANDGLTGCGVDAIGIYYQNSSGTITDSAVRNVLLPASLQGCQDGLAINVESNAGTPAVTISNNSVRNYDKNGITASGPGTAGVGPNVTITGNTVVGLGPTTVTAQNGIQVGGGASGKITSNIVTDDIFTNSPDCASAGTCTGSSGIIIFASAGVVVSGNTVESTQFGIVPVTDPASGGSANSTTIKSNHIGGTQTFDAIDVCSDGNLVQSNFIYGSSQDGIHLDDSCPPSTGGNNTVSGNTINEGCAGILLGSGTSNTTTPNTFMNVTHTTLAGDVCTPAVGKMSSLNRSSLRPSPLKPSRK
jgi:Right handed beta helix region